MGDARLRALERRWRETVAAWADALERLERTLLEPRVTFVARGATDDLRRAAAALEAEVDQTTADALEGDLPLASTPAAAAALRAQVGGRVSLELAGVRRFGPVPAARAAQVLDARRRERSPDDTPR